MTSHDHNDRPAPITNLGLSKIDNFGQVLLCEEKTRQEQRRKKHFFVNAYVFFCKGLRRTVLLWLFYQ